MDYSLRAMRNIFSHLPKTGLYLPLALTWLLMGLSTPAPGPASPQVSSPAAQRLELDFSKAPPAPADRYYAQLWMVSSAEYRALCLQSFNSALDFIRRQVEQAPVVEGRAVDALGRPLAIVTDLDETILDNSGYQTRMILAKRDYTSPTWDAWARGQEVRLVPGAGDFLEEVGRLKVQVVFISNRSASLRQETLQTLERLGVDVSAIRDPAAMQLLLREQESSKEPRRQLASARFRVIAFLGDNLGDFPGVLGENNDARRAKVPDYQELWGRGWFVLPNPVYGDWTGPFRGQAPAVYLEKLFSRENE